MYKEISQDDLLRKEVRKFQNEVDFVYYHDTAVFATPREKIKSTF
jgi:hypothetical protein